MKNKKILITGGTGFIGSELCKALLNRDYEITVLTRKTGIPNQGKINYINDLEQKEFDYNIVINLCGEPISCRWSQSKKNKIYDSRILITKKLVQKILSAKVAPELFINGSAIGYYGTSQTQIFQEKTLPANQNLFSQKLCYDWEMSANESAKATRLVIIRTGVVIGKNGGIIKKMLIPFKLGFGGKIGSGQQPISWIHLDDVLGAIFYIIDNKNISGAVNLCAPTNTTNFEFSKRLAVLLNRPCFFSIPGILMKLIYKEMASELLLLGQKVYPQKLLDNGYKFKFVDLKSAIKQSLTNN